MNTRTDTVAAFSSTPFAAPATSRLASLALSAVLTLAMLGGVHWLAATDAAAPQMAQAATPRA